MRSAGSRCSSARFVERDSGTSSFRGPCPHPWSTEYRIERLLVVPAGFCEQPHDETRSDLGGLNGLYQRVPRRADQLARCLRFDAPAVIVELELARMQQALRRLMGVPRQRPGPGPTICDHLRRALVTTTGARLDAEVEALLAALHLVSETSEPVEGHESTA